MSPLSENDPFSEVRLKKSSLPIKRNPPSENDPFAEARIKKVDELGGIYETGRHAARIGSRIAEVIGGIPGDVQSLIQSGVLSGLEKIGGIPASKESKEKLKRQRAPTSFELQEISEKKTKGFTSAKNSIEKTGDEIVKTVASLVGPMKFRKALGVGLASEAAKEGLNILGTGEGAQEAGKLGTMFLMTMINPGGALNYASSQYKKADQLSKGASISAKSLEDNLKNLVQDLEKGVTTPSKNAILKPTQELISKINKGKISVRDLTAAKRDLNTLIKDPALLKREKKLFNYVGKEIDRAIKPYEKLNPEFSKAYRPANEIYGAVMTGTKASDFINKTLGNKSLFGAIAGEALLGHAEYIAPTFAAIMGARGLAKTSDFFTRLAKSPELQKFYTKAMVAAAKEDAAALRLYSDKFEEELIKSNLEKKKNHSLQK